MELSRRSRRHRYLVSSVHLSDTIITNPLAILPGPFYFVSSLRAWDGLLPDYSARFYDYASAAAFNTTLHSTSSDPDTPRTAFYHIIIFTTLPVLSALDSALFESGKSA